MMTEAEREAYRKGFADCRERAAARARERISANHEPDPETVAYREGAEDLLDDILALKPEDSR